MVKYLTENYRIKGISYTELIKLLGKPDNEVPENKGEISYDIQIKYDSDTHQVYIKTLNLKFNKDSTIIDFKILEWEKSIIPKNIID